MSENLVRMHADPVLMPSWLSHMLDQHAHESGGSSAGRKVWVLEQRIANYAEQHARRAIRGVTAYTG